MRLADTTLRKYKLLSLVLLIGSAVLAQDNSPYSRYGLGNLYPQTSIINRSMGGVSAAYTGTYIGRGYFDVTTVNFNNPASYGAFNVTTEQRSGKVAQARVILDAGVNINSRTLKEPNTPESFTSTDLLFSHVYVGIPIKKNWGIAFGLRPLSRISYDILRKERLRNPNGTSIDSAATEFTGTGGSFLPTIGTGFGTNNFRVGVNVGYLFGRKEIATRRVFINDTVAYAASSHSTNASFGSLFLNGGVQYTLPLDTAKKHTLQFGAYGNIKRSLSGTQDILRQTYVRNSSGEELQVDSVFRQTDVAGEVIYPTSYTVGFLYNNAPGLKTRGWSAGLDYSTSKWSEFRFFGTQDLVQDSWEIRAGLQLSPSQSASRYGQFISYRFGFFTGQDYINADKKLPVLGFSFGMGLPLLNYSRLSNQYSVVNLGLEYSRRGNDENKIKENLFRVSLGLNFTDLWFGKRRYD